MLLEGIIRRFDALRGGKGPIDLRMTFAESLAAAQVEPSGHELTRAGRRVIVGNSAAITGIAPVQALPTTTAQWVIYNADTLKTYFIETLGMYCTSGTPGVGGIMLAALFTLPVPTAGSTAGVSISSASGSGPASGSKAVVKSSPATITIPAAPNWVQVAENPSPNVGAFPGSGCFANRNIAGRIAIPPGACLGLNLVTLAGTTPLYAPFAEWVELETDLE